MSESAGRPVVTHTLTVSSPSDSEKRGTARQQTYPQLPSLDSEEAPEQTPQLDLLLLSVFAGLSPVQEWAGEHFTTGSLLGLTPLAFTHTLRTMPTQPHRIQPLERLLLATFLFLRIRNLPTTHSTPHLRTPLPLPLIPLLPTTTSTTHARTTHTRLLRLTTTNAGAAGTLCLAAADTSRTGTTAHATRTTGTTRACLLGLSAPYARATTTLCLATPCTGAASTSLLRLTTTNAGSTGSSAGSLLGLA